jgi:monofunctional biosynthetic peptidoglycan transglycosylase
MSPLLLNFGSEGNTQNWFSITDRVMGGRSDTRLSQTTNSLVLEGVVSLKNNGGFVSCRSETQRFSLSTYSRVHIKYRSEGQKIAFTLHPNDRYYLPKYKVFLEETDMEWQEVSFNLNNFQQTVMGDVTGKGITEAILDQIMRLGFITTEKKEGAFTFEVASITFS